MVDCRPVLPYARTEVVHYRSIRTDCPCYDEETGQDAGHLEVRDPGVHTLVRDVCLPSFFSYMLSWRVIRFLPSTLAVYILLGGCEETFSARLIVNRRWSVSKRSTGKEKRNRQRERTISHNEPLLVFKD